MKIIKEGIVFSNDIQRILEGYNAINFSYNKTGITIPDNNFITNLRNDFADTVNKIFNGNTAIISEEEMENCIYSSIQDVIGRFPHHLLR